MFPFGFVRGDVLFAVCSVQQLGELGRYAPGVGEYQWREFLVVSPDFFGIGAEVRPHLKFYMVDGSENEFWCSL